jgi:hypothetical protein
VEVEPKLEHLVHQQVALIHQFQETKLPVLLSEPLKERVLMLVELLEQYQEEVLPSSETKKNLIMDDK